MYKSQETKGTHHKGKASKYGYIKIILKYVFIERYFKENETRNHETKELSVTHKTKDMFLLLKQKL